MFMEESVQELHAKKGLSKATVIDRGSYVIKIGLGMAEQARHCMKMRGIAPKIFHYSEHLYGADSYYVMEKLQEPDYATDPQWAEDTLCAMVQMLRHIWRLSTPRYEQPGWQAQLTKFCLEQGVFDVTKLMHELQFDDLPLGAPESMHGDPTLANVMLRNGELVICDPIPAGGKIPAHWTVDVGKLLQSAIGWERHLYGMPIERDACVRAVLGDLDELHQRRCWFWCMVHLLRIIPYAHSTCTAEWCYRRASIIYSTLTNGDARCFMLLT